MAVIETELFTLDRVFPYSDAIDEDPLFETANACYYMNGNIYTQCYEWLGGVVIDPFAAPLIPHESIEFSWMRSYGHESDFISIGKSNEK